MRKILSQREVDELRTLYAKLPGATWQAVNRLRIFTPATALEGDDLQRFAQVHDEVRQIMAQMDDILGK